MLLENKSKLHFFAELDLKFEDDSTKKLTVNIGDTINISFKCNGVKITKQGVVTNIYPSRIIESQLYGSKKLSAVLELDCSSQFKSFCYKVDINDILDILPIVENPDDGTGFPNGEICKCNSDDNENNIPSDEDETNDGENTETGSDTLYNNNVWNDLEELIPKDLL